MNVPAPKTTSPLFEDVYRHLDVGIAVYDVVGHGEDFVFASMNPAALAISKVREDDVIGECLSEAFPGAEAMGVTPALRRVLATGASESLPPLHYVDDRTDAWYRNDIHRLDSGQLMAVYVDVTADIKAGAELEASKTRYRLLTSSLNDGIYDWDIAADTLYLSPGWKAQLGYTDDELPSNINTWQEALHPDERENVNRQLQAFIEGGIRTWEMEFRLRHKDGSYRWIHSRGTGIRNPETDRVARILGVHIDIHERKLERLKADSQRKTIEALFRAIPDLFFLLDDRHHILDAHGGSEESTFQIADDVIGRKLETVLPDDIDLGLFGILHEARLTGKPVSHDISLHRGGKERILEARVIASADATYSLTIRNVTKRREIEREMEIRVAQLEALRRIQQLTMGSHAPAEMLRGLTAALAHAVRISHGVFVDVSLDDLQSRFGDPRVGGHSFAANIFDGSQTRGRIALRLDTRSTPHSETQSFVNSVALALGMWIRSEDARRELQTYEKIVGNTQDQLALIDLEGRYRIVNGAYAARIGRDPGEFLGQTVAEMLSPSGFGDKQLAMLREAMDGKVRQYREWRETPDGDRYMNVLYSPYRQDGELTGVIISAHDITDLHDAQAQLRRAARVFSSSGEAVLMTEPDGTITDVNQAFTDICGYTAIEAIGRKPTLISSQRHPKSFFEEMFATIEREGRWHGEIWNRRRNGEIFPCLMTVSPVEDGDDQIGGYVGVFSDITQIKENERRLEVMANHDPLTGLANRAQLSRSLQSRIDRAQSDAGAFSLLFIDLDRFKAVNDALGHAAGDELLRQATQRLKRVLRVNDILARVGGDEFIAVLDDLESPTSASIIASKIIEQLNEAFSLLGQTASVSASIGIATFPADGTDVDTLIRHADTAMYRAKQEGRAGWRFYSSEMTAASQRHRTLLDALSGSRERDEHSLHYQPKLDVVTGKLVGLEALVRWDHPDLGRVDASEFIVAAEAGGLMRDIDYWVIDAVCNQIRNWQAQGLSPPVVAINLSPRTILSNDLPERVQSLLERDGLMGQDLCFELPDAALQSGNGQLRDQLKILDDMGIQLSVDHFGSGESGIASLTRLPISEIKIDGALVASLGDGTRAEAIVSAIEGIGRHLDLRVTASGVETERQREFLSGLAPLSVQGFLYASPRDGEETTELLREQDTPIP